MMQPVLRVKDLSVRYGHTEGESIIAVRRINFALEPGTVTGVIGESGCGKSSLALALMGLLKKRARVQGEIFYGPTDLNRLSEQEWNQYRWSKLAIVFQNSLDILNPVMTIGEQIGEAMRRHTSLTGTEIRVGLEELLKMVGLDPVFAKSYPHQLSGGMRQKVLIAMALSCEPEVLIVDEPTTALDAVAKDEIVELLLGLQRKMAFPMLVISHEMQVIMRMTSRLMVMYAGNVVEEGLTGEIFKNPMHPYTRGLMYSSPAVNPYRDLWGIPGEAGRESEGQCPFCRRCNQCVERCAKEHPELSRLPCGRKVSCLRGGIVTLLEGRNLHKSYHWRGGEIKACSSCDICVKSGEAVVLIGESGSGKTTLAEILAGIMKAEQGQVLFEGQIVTGHSHTARKGGMQIVFQDPLSATSERLTVEDVVREPLDILHADSKEQRRESVRQALKDVQLPRDANFLSRRCYMLSGGQRQRVAIARCLVMEPKLLIADEISSMLDPSTQANILRLLKGLQNSKGFAMLYITHDLTMAQKIADRIYVMRRAEIIERKPAGDFFCNPGESQAPMLLQCAGIKCGN